MLSAFARYIGGAMTTTVSPSLLLMAGNQDSRKMESGR